MYKLLKDFFLSSFSQCMVVIVGFFCLIITVKSFGIAGRGQYAAAYAIVSTLGLIFGWSLGRSSLHLKADYYGDISDFFKDYLFTISMGFITLLGFSILCFDLIIKIFPNIQGQVLTRYLWITMLSLPYFMWRYVGRFFYSQIDKIHFQNIIVVINRSSLVLCLLYFISIKNYSLTALFIIFSTVNVLSFFIEVASLFFLVKPKYRFDLNLYKKMFTVGTVVHIDSIFMYFMFSVNIVIVNMVLGIKAAGIYSIVMQFYSALFIFPTMGHILLQRGLVTKFNRIELLKNIKIYFLLSMLISILATPVVYFAISWMLSYSGVNDISVHDFMFYLYLSMLPSFLFMSIVHILNPVLIFYKKIFNLLKYTIILGTLNIVLLYFLLPVFGMYGASVIVFLIYLFMFFVYLKLLNQDLFRFADNIKMVEV